MKLGHCSFFEYVCTLRLNLVKEQGENRGNGEAGTEGGMIKLFSKHSASIEGGAEVMKKDDSEK